MTDTCDHMRDDSETSKARYLLRTLRRRRNIKGTSVLHSMVPHKTLLYSIMSVVESETGLEGLETVLSVSEKRCHSVYYLILSADISRSSDPLTVDPKPMLLLRLRLVLFRSGLSSDLP